MFSFKIVIAAAVLACVSARYIVLDDETGYLLPFEALEDLETDVTRTGRMRRQVHGSFASNSDGTSGLNLNLPLAGNDKNILSAIGGADFDRNHKIIGQTAGLALNNVNGHSLMVSGSKLPGADRVTAAGQVNLFNNGVHKLDANAFAARTMPKNSPIPSFNTYGGGADYMFKNKIGAGVNIARTPLFDKTDYSAVGKLNLFQNRDSSLDFNAGLSKSVSPFLPKSSWQPNYGLTFKKWF